MDARRVVERQGRCKTGHMNETPDLLERRANVRDRDPLFIAALHGFLVPFLGGHPAATPARDHPDVLRVRPLTPLVLVGLISVAVGGCADEDASGTTVAPELGGGASFDFTPTIKITDDGFVPLQAVAVFGETLTFVNETDRPQTIHFTNGSPAIGGAQTIGPIPPGESRTFPKPLEAAISLVYEADALPGETGRLQIDPGVDTL